MNIRQNAAAEAWDMGLAELIEETPAVNSFQPTRFLEIVKSDEKQVFMARQEPSWSHQGLKRKVA